MRIPNSAHTSLPWRIHEIAPDFKVEDVWALPTPGSPDEFPRLVRLMASSDPSANSSPVAGLLWSARWKLGAVLGWDRPGTGLDGRVPSLRDRLPADLREATGPEFPALPFSPVYLSGNEFVAETANRTVHAAMHVSWVPDGSGGYRGQMAALVKPNGPLGAGYLAGIGPLRSRIVYPAMMRRLDRGWRTSATSAT